MLKDSPPPPGARYSPPAERSDGVNKLRCLNPRSDNGTSIGDTCSGGAGLDPASSHPIALYRSSLPVQSCCHGGSGVVVIIPSRVSLARSLCCWMV